MRNIGQWRKRVFWIINDITLWIIIWSSNRVKNRNHILLIWSLILFLYWMAIVRDCFLKSACPFSEFIIIGIFLPCEGVLSPSAWLFFIWDKDIFDPGYLFCECYSRESRGVVWAEDSWLSGLFFFDKFKNKGSWYIFVLTSGTWLFINWAFGNPIWYYSCKYISGVLKTILVLVSFVFFSFDGTYSEYLRLMRDKYCLLLL